MVKKIAKCTAVSFMVMLLLCVSLTNAFAAGIKVNDLSVEKGEKVTYILKLGDAKEIVGAIDLYVDYDSDSLEVDKETLNIPYAPSPICNATTPGKIVFNSIAVTGIDFSAEHILFSVSFKVKDDAKDTQIKATMRQIIADGETIEEIHDMGPDDYKLTELVQLEEVPQDEVVVPGDGFDQIEELQKEAEAQQEQQGISVQTIVIIAVAAVLVAAIIIGVVFSKKKKKNEEKSTKG